MFARWSYVPELCDPKFANDQTAKGCSAGDFGQFDPAASYFDASVRWNVTDNFQVVGVINNIFDSTAPQTPSGLFVQANTDPQLYLPGVLGRISRRTPSLLW